MLRFSKLRLTGFKSFVDPTDLQIKPGLTGVVGPNGCGKSNLVEALRWVMGETSARQMRGNGMEDVIFGGTENRPARNIAEVVLNLDNQERTAPAQFNEFDELDISRRIEREKGSTYRVNGKEMRAKDVQLLFADSSSGARSTAMVSQGRVGAVINAKPAQRRTLLEEAAGITGLHSRRHDAELRLSGAETNLERLEDILITLNTQLKGLKKQTRQANRYRNLSDHIRKAEATLFYLRWISASKDLETSKEELKISKLQVDELTRQASVASKTQIEIAAELPQLRQIEGELSTKLYSLNVERENLNEEKNRITDSKVETKKRLDQITTDLHREKAIAQDAEDAINALNSERKKIEESRENEEQRRQDARKNLIIANEKAQGLDEKLTNLSDQFAESEARRSSFNKTIEDLIIRSQRLNMRADETAKQINDLEIKTIDTNSLSEAERCLSTCRSNLEEARDRANFADQARNKATEEITESMSIQHAFQSTLTKLLAEEKALSEILKVNVKDDWSVMIDEVTVSSGVEVALATALGEDLSASNNEQAPVYWRTLKPYDQPTAVPLGSEPLSNFVSAPPALTRCLSQIGLVQNKEIGASLIDELKQGQCLVTRAGDLWRWDGYTLSAGAETAAAMRLQQRNRLKIVQDSLSKARADMILAEEGVKKARQKAEETQIKDREERTNSIAAETAYNKALENLAEIKERSVQYSSKLSSLIDTNETTKIDIEETETRIIEARRSIEKIPNTDEIWSQITNLRTNLAEHRTSQVECQSAYDTLVHNAKEHEKRLNDIEHELQNWQRRHKGATLQISLLSERKTMEETEIVRLESLPNEIEKRRADLIERFEKSKQNRNKAADKLSEAEIRLSEADKVLRKAEMALSKARENWIRSEGVVEISQQATDSISQQVLNKLDAKPEQLFVISDLVEGKTLPELDASERKVERLTRERDTMGPVNLRAEQETKELNDQIDALGTERNDLIEAIAKLRKGISELNREGRKRLLDSFHEVDKHFQNLFTKLFGGGKAHLSLVDSEDPLQAGLEIMASPPGKRLQSLSLLSGGEQALTALALLFGVFLTNPAPICVLDEVDAPLDDSNVDRFCSILHEMAKSGATRFLIVTHHRLTMAKMDRLFGVTMSERGVSQLVSVDLRYAEKLQKSA